VGRGRVQALDEALFAPSGSESVSLAETLTDPLAELPGDALDEHDVHQALLAALAELPERSRAVVIHSYVDGLTLAQIGEVLGVTESRVCQLRGQALRQVRASLLSRMHG
jgi:RNA polymerase sigma factor for flagellar operon FliA